MSINVTPDEAVDLAVDLLNELTGHIGDADAIDAALLRWVADHGAATFGFICAAAVQTVFTECLTLTPIEDVPAGRLAFTTAERTPA